MTAVATAGGRAAGGDQMRRFLIVANQTLGGDTLLDAVRERIRQGPCEFWVVVPATPPAQLTPPRSPGGSRMPATPRAAGPAEDRTAAQRRLRQGLTRLREAGATADGEVGAGSPLQAVGECLARRPFDEIILSTLPSGASRWLRQDLPRRMVRRYGLPVTHLVTDLPPFFRAAGPPSS